MNVVVLQGNLVDDPKLMGTENKVARFTLAVNNGYGENTSTTFADCVAFGKQAEVIAEHLRKGKQIIVNGQLMQSRWEDKETGQKRSKLEVRLNNFGGFAFVSGGSRDNAAETTAEIAGDPAPAATGDGKLF